MFLDYPCCQVRSGAQVTNFSAISCYATAENGGNSYILSVLSFHFITVRTLRPTLSRHRRGHSRSGSSPPERYAPSGLSLPLRCARGPLPLTEPRAATPSGGLPPFGRPLDPSPHLAPGHQIAILCAKRAQGPLRTCPPGTESPFYALNVPRSPFKCEFRSKRKDSTRTRKVNPWEYRHCSKLLSRDTARGVDLFDSELIT